MTKKKSEITLSDATFENIHQIEYDARLAIAEKLDTEIRATGKKTADLIWTLGQYCFWLDYYELYDDLAYKDPNTGELKHYESFMDYANRCEDLPVNGDQAYKYMGIYKDFRHVLGIPDDDSELNKKLRGLGIEKLNILRKLLVRATSIEQINHWLDIAYQPHVSVPVLRLMVQDELLGSQSKPKSHPRDKIILPRRRWRTPRLTKNDLRGKQLDELITDLNIPDNAIVEVSVRILGYRKEEE